MLFRSNQYPSSLISLVMMDLTITDMTARISKNSTMKTTYDFSHERQMSVFRYFPHLHRNTPFHSFCMQTIVFYGNKMPAAVTALFCFYVICSIQYQGKICMPELFLFQYALKFFICFYQMLRSSAIFYDRHLTCAAECGKILLYKGNGAIVCALELWNWKTTSFWPPWPAARTRPSV